MAMVSYMLLKWNSGATEKRFKVALADASHRGLQSLATHARGITGNLITVSAPAPKRISGVINIYDPVLEAEYGTMAELEAAYIASDLQAKMHAESVYWDARFTMPELRPSAANPLATLMFVPFVLEEKTPT